MSSVTVVRSLTDYRLQKAQRRLERRLRNAETVFTENGNFKAMYRLKNEAILDFLAAVPELKDINAEAKNTFIKRALNYGGPTGDPGGTISRHLGYSSEKQTKSGTATARRFRRGLSLARTSLNVCK